MRLATIPNERGLAGAHDVAMWVFTHQDLQHGRVSLALAMVEQLVDDQALSAQVRRKVRQTQHALRAIRAMVWEPLGIRGIDSTGVEEVE